LLNIHYINTYLSKNL